MQVSWIDADEVRDLVALLAEPPPRSDSAAPDLSTLPETADRFGFEFLSEKPAAVAWQPAGMAPAPAPSEVEAAIQPDINQIREKLRLIRDRAQAAGLLTKKSPVPPSDAPSTPIPPPVAALPAALLAPAVTLQPAVSTPPAAVQPAPSPPPPPEVSVALSEPAPVAAPSPPPQQPAVAANVRATPEQSTIVERLDEFAQWSAKLTTSEELFMLDDHGDLLWGSPTSDGLLVCAKLAMNASMRSQAATLAKPAPATPVQVSPGQELQLVSCPTLHGNVTLALVNPQQVPAASLREALALALDR